MGKSSLPRLHVFFRRRQKDLPEYVVSTAPVSWPLRVAVGGQGYVGACAARTETPDGCQYWCGRIIGHMGPCVAYVGDPLKGWAVNVWWWTVPRDLKNYIQPLLEELSNL